MHRFSSIILILTMSACERAEEAPANSVQVATMPEIREAEREPGPPRYDFNETYIARVFREQLGELPRMGWFEEDLFLAAEELPSLALYARPGAPNAAIFRSPLPLVEEESLRQFSRFACEVEPGQLFAYSTGEIYRSGERGLFTSRGLSPDSSSSMRTVDLSTEQLQSIVQLLGWPTETLRRHQAVMLGVGGPFYSLHQRYNAESILAEEALVLHDPTGAVIAYERSRFEGEMLCDGCALPPFDGGSYGYRIVNMFNLQGFEFPVLLLNTDTVEGRALMLLTFTPEGDVSTYRTYEYVVRC